MFPLLNLDLKLGTEWVSCNFVCFFFFKTISDSSKYFDSFIYVKLSDYSLCIAKYTFFFFLNLQYTLEIFIIFSPVFFFLHLFPLFEVLWTNIHPNLCTAFLSILACSCIFFLSCYRPFCCSLTFIRIRHCKSWNKRQLSKCITHYLDCAVHFNMWNHKKLWKMCHTALVLIEIIGVVTMIANRDQLDFKEPYTCLIKATGNVLIWMSSSIWKHEHSVSVKKNASKVNVSVFPLILLWADVPP